MALDKSRLGSIPSEWDVAEMRDAVAVKEGLVDPRSEPYASMLHVGPDNIIPKTGHILPCKRAKDQGLISGKYLFNPNDIVYSKIRPYLRKAIIADFQGLCSADAYPLTAKPGFDTKYLLATILSDAFSDQATSQQDRTGIPKVNREQLASIVIPKPPEEEQKAIGKIIESLRSAIEVQDKIIATLNELKSAVMADLIPRAADVAQEPDGWTAANFDDCIDGLPTRLKSIPKSLFKTTGKYPIIDQGQDYIGGYTDDESSVYQSGLPVIVFGDHTRALKYVDRSFAAGADGTKIFRAGSSLDPLFLFYALVRLEIPSRGYNRHYPLLREQKILYPVDKVVQRGIATSIRDVDLRIETAERKLSQFNALFQSSLRELMSGSLRTTPLLAG